MADLVIKVTGDIKNYQAALEDADKSTQDLKESLGKIAIASGVVFAAVTAEIGLAVKAFGDSQKASNSLTQALQNQGIYSDDLAEGYKNQAKELQKLTGIDDDAIVKAQAILQGMIGQQEISETLTKAIVDLSEAKHMDLDSTAELIGKGIAGHTMALKKLGIEIDENLNKEERTAKIIELVNIKFGDQAAAANKGLGSIRGLHSAFGDFQENIGEHFAPLIERAIASLTKFFVYINNNKALTDLIPVVLGVAAAVTGLITAVATVSAALAAFYPIALVFGTTLAAAVGPIALIVAGVGALGGAMAYALLNTKEATHAIVDHTKSISALKAEIKKLESEQPDLTKLSGYQLEQYKKGKEARIEVLKANLVKEKSLQEEFDTANTDGQIKSKKDLADKLAVKESENEARKKAVLEAEIALNKAKAQESGDLVIKIRTKELETLKQIADDKNASIRDALEIHLAKLQLARGVASEQEKALQLEIQTELLNQNKEYMALDEADRELYKQKYLESIKSQLETEKSIKLSAANKSLVEDTKKRNLYLEEEQKYGKTLASINKFTREVINDDTKSAFGQMAAMTSSHNVVLKSIGKAAAIANIIIATQESAAKVLAGFSTIPIIGPALGIAAAGTVVAFGADRIAGVLAAADGGLVTGGIPGVDSVSARLMPGELVVPTRNYEEVVSSVAASRNGGGDSGSSSGPAYVEIMLTLKDDLMDFIETKLVERERIGISLQRG